MKNSLPRLSASPSATHAPSTALRFNSATAATSPNLARFMHLLAAPCAALFLAGCTRTLLPIFPDVLPPILWPPPPDVPRIRYVGTLTGEESLRRPPTAAESLRSLLEGPVAKPRFASPIAVAVSGSRLAVADPSALGGPCVFLLDLDSRSFTTLRPIGDYALRWPIDLAWIDRRIAVADAQRADILIFNPDGVLHRRISGDQLNRPSSLAWDPDSRRLLVADAATQQLLVFDDAGSLLRALGGPGHAPGSFNRPTGLAIAPPRTPFCLPPPASTRPSSTSSSPQSQPTSPTPPALAVADAMNFRILVFDADFDPLLSFGKKGDAAGDFSLPRDLAFDSYGHLYVLDNQFENVQIFDPSGRLLMAFGENGAGPGQFNIPSGIAIDEHDRIWIADTYNARVQVFQFLPESHP